MDWSSARVARMRRRADLKTGTTCNSNCVFCVIGDQLFTGDRTTEDCIAELRASRATCDDVVFTGAEVTIRPDFFTLVRAATRLGYERIQIQTNGRMFAYREFCERAIAAGANEFSPAIHGHEAQLHDGLTRAPGSFVQITTAMRHLAELDQRVVTNTVITKQNAKHLPALARLLVELGVAQYQLAFPHPTGHAARHFRGIVPRMAEIAPYVHEALRIGIAAGVPCMAEAMPYCLMPGLEPQVGELHIPATEIVYDGYVVPDYATDRMDRGKVRFPQCASCRFEPICEGPWREYPATLGSDEFVPVAGARVVDTAIVLDDRFALLGTIAPELPPPAPRTGWRAVLVYPQAFSPECTAEVCGVRDGLAELDARGIAVVGLAPDDAATQASFAAACSLPFPLVADPQLALATALGARAGDRGVRRSTYLVDPEGRIAHVIVDVDAGDHARQIARAHDRLHAPARPLGPGPELVVLRRPAERRVAP
ncbi:MAG TPA: redoxin domain-containing protein [Nannocystaceae bacterium]|nr:redoxin domain-containing protein [Nannocystaceae bacterium]